MIPICIFHLLNATRWHVVHHRAIRVSRNRVELKNDVFVQRLFANHNLNYGKSECSCSISNWMHSWSIWLKLCAADHRPTSTLAYKMVDMRSLHILNWWLSEHARCPSMLASRLSVCVCVCFLKHEHLCSGFRVECQPQSHTNTGFSIEWFFLSFFIF